jgi:hypothetical protein
MPLIPVCQVSIDASGLLKVTHMMNMLGRGPGATGPGGGPGGSAAPHGASLGGSLMLSTQVGRGAESGSRW